MRATLSAAIFVFAAGLIGCGSQMAESQDNSPAIIQPAPSETRQPVLVELFTSEGCSSCPPADRTLAFLNAQQPVAGAEIITLAYHVDYWNSSSWKDRFSSPFYSQRQESYSHKFNLDSIYTPQMVVDGQAQFVGSNQGQANDEIAKAEKLQKGKIDAGIDGGKLNLSISELPKHTAATVYLAATEDNLSSNVRGGENSGSTLKHVSVVRELKSLGLVEDGAKEFKAETSLPTNAEWKSENVKYIVFVQENAGRQILAVRQIKN